MDPLEFLEVAKAFSDSVQERQTRTSIGRAYYAVFNHLRQRLEPLKPLPLNAEAHALVVRYLSDAPNQNLKSLGQTLNDLRNSRNTADYNMNVTVDAQQSKLALQRAERAIQRSQSVSAATLKAAIDALPAYRGR